MYTFFLICRLVRIKAASTWNGYSRREKRSLRTKVKYELTDHIDNKFYRIEKRVFATNSDPSFECCTVCGEGTNTCHCIK
jgi:hypothetical protein